MSIVGGKVDTIIEIGSAILEISVIVDRRFCSCYYLPRANRRFSLLERPLANRINSDSSSQQNIASSVTGSTAICNNYYCISSIAT